MIKHTPFLPSFINRSIRLGGSPFSPSITYKGGQLGGTVQVGSWSSPSFCASSVKIFAEEAARQTAIENRQKLRRLLIKAKVPAKELYKITGLERKYIYKMARGEITMPESTFKLLNAILTNYLEK